MRYLYDKNTGNIVGKYSDNVDIDGCLHYAPKGYKQNMNYIQLDLDIYNLKHYKVDLTNSQLIKRSQQEIDEIQQYGKLLTDSDRLLNKLKPSHEEIQKAQNTIEILTLIQEVIQ